MLRRKVAKVHGQDRVRTRSARGGQDVFVARVGQARPHLGCISRARERALGVCRRQLRAHARDVSGLESEIANEHPLELVQDVIAHRRSDEPRFSHPQKQIAERRRDEHAGVVDDHGSARSSKSCVNVRRVSPIFPQDRAGISRAQVSSATRGTRGHALRRSHHEQDSHSHRNSQLLDRRVRW